MTAAVLVVERVRPAASFVVTISRTAIVCFFLVAKQLQRIVCHSYFDVPFVLLNGHVCIDTRPSVFEVLQTLSPLMSFYDLTTNLVSKKSPTEIATSRQSVTPCEHADFQWSVSLGCLKEQRRNTNFVRLGRKKNTCPGELERLGKRNSERIKCQSKH